MQQYQLRCAILTLNNTAPIATDDSFYAVTDQQLSSSVISNDIDPDSDVITIAGTAGEVATLPQMTSTAQGGLVTLNIDGTFIYTPPAGYIGEDSFDYSIVDPSGAIDSATVTIAVTPDNPNTNDGPSAGDDLIAGGKNESAITNLLANDTDPESDPITIKEVNGVDPSAGPVTIVDPSSGNPAGTVTVNPTTGEALFTPTNDFVGSVQIPYSVVDANGNTDTATITISTFDSPPIAADDIHVAEINQTVAGNVLSNDSDPNPNDALTIVDPETGIAAVGAVSFTTAGGGLVVMNPDGSYIYTPAAGFTGEDTFQYEVIDELGNTDTADVSVEVRDLNVPIDPANPALGYNASPIATNDSFTSFADALVTSSVLSNDADPDGGSVMIADSSGAELESAQTITTTAGGAVTLNPNGTFSYVPPVGFIGEDTFDYTIVDTHGATDSATVTFSVVANADPSANANPVAGTDLLAASVGEPAQANLLGNDIDPNGEALAIESVGGVDPSTGSIAIVNPATGYLAGMLTVNPSTGETTFIPESGFTGTIQVPYSIVDGNGGTDTGNMIIMISDANPIAENDSAITNVGESVSGEVLSNDVDPNPADSLTIYNPVAVAPATAPFTIVTTQGGTVVMSPNGAYEYTAASGFAGIDSFDYTTVDSFGKTDSASVSVSVRGTGEWSVSAPAVVGEGETSPFTISLSGIYGIGEIITIELGIADEGTNSEDYTDFLTAVQSSAASDPDVNFDPATGTLAYVAPSNGASMTDLVVDLALTDDGLIEGQEDFSVMLGSASSSTGGVVTVDQNSAFARTTIVDAQGPGLWSVTGVTESHEGAATPFTISLTGDYSAGEVITVDISLSNIGANDSDYSEIVTSISAAVSNNPDVSFNPVTGSLIYKAPTDGASMNDVTFELPLTDDELIEGQESFSVELNNAASPTGSSVGLDTNGRNFTTTINDTQGPGSAGSGGLLDGPGEWNVSGATTIDEGTTAQYTVTLGGVYGAGEVVNVDISLRDIETSFDDYSSFVAAIEAAVADNPQVTFEPVGDATAAFNEENSRTVLFDGANNLSGTLTYTAPSDGASMEDLIIDFPIVDDSIVEDSEAYAIELSNAFSPTGALVEIANHSVETSIENNDYPAIGEPEIGAVVSGESLYVPNEYEPIDILDFSAPSNGFRQLVALGDDVLLQTINGIQALDSFGASTLNYLGFSRGVFDGGLDQALHIQYLDQAFSEGFSSGKGFRGTNSIDPTDDCGRIYIDTIVLGDSLAINAHSTIDPQRSAGVIGYTMTLSDGSPLPSWISTLASGEYIVHRAIANELILLKVIAHRDGAPDLVRIVEINALTGLITEVAGSNNVKVNK